MSVRPGALRTALSAAGAQPPLARTACRCAGLLGLGALTGGLAVAGLPLVAPDHREWLAGLGLTAAAALYAMGLLEVPGIRGSRTGRLRVALDGVSAGLLIALVGWLLVPDQATRHPVGYVSATVAAACVAITVATLLRAYRRPDAGTWALVLRCGGGAVLAVVGLALLVVTVGLAGGSGTPVVPPLPARILLFAAAVLAVSVPPLLRAGARRVPGQVDAVISMSAPAGTRCSRSRWPPSRWRSHTTWSCTAWPATPSWCWRW